MLKTYDFICSFKFLKQLLNCACRFINRIKRLCVTRLVWKINPRGSKFIIIKYVTFHETRMERKYKDIYVKELKTMVQKSSIFEVEVPTNETKDNKVF